MNKPHILMQYARKKGKRIGVAVAYLSNKGDVKVGFSKCHKDDEFDPRVGRNMALKRATEIGDIPWDVVPHDLKFPVNNVMDRAIRAFIKNKKPVLAVTAPRRRFAD